MLRDLSNLLNHSIVLSTINNKYNVRINVFCSFKCLSFSNYQLITKWAISNRAIQSTGIP